MIRVIPAVTRLSGRRTHPGESETASSRPRARSTECGHRGSQRAVVRRNAVDDDEVSRAGGASGDGGPGVGGEGGRLLLASTAALALTIGVACDDARAFAPIKGCSDPGSPYDTGVSSETTSAYGVTGCTKLYQPARAAELRAAAGAEQADSVRAKDADGGVRGRTTTDELGSNDSN